MKITTGVHSCLILVLSFGFAAAQRCTAGEYRPNPNTCNGFLQCVHGSLVKMPCPAGLHWNDRIKVCDWPQNANCRVTTTSPTTTTTKAPTTTTTKAPTTTTTRVPTTAVPTTTEESSKNVTTEGQRCTAGEYRPNPNTCNGFLQCVHGSLVKMPCPAGLHWNDRIKVCDWPQNANCRVTTTSPTTTTTKAPTTTTTKAPTTTTTRVPTTAVPTTTEESSKNVTTEGQRCTAGEYRPNPNTCNGFLQCVHGSLVKMPCPAGLHWNDRIKVCDWPQNANCRVTTASPSTTTTTEAPTTTEEKLVETTSSASNTTRVCKCGDHFPSQKDCAQFYRCEDNILVLHSCPSGLHWNTELEVCDWPYSANCTLHTSGEPLSSTTTTSRAPTTTTTTRAPTTTTTTTRAPTTTTTTRAPTTTTTTTRAPTTTKTTTTRVPTTTTTTRAPTTTTTTRVPTTTKTTTTRAPTTTKTTTTRAPTTTKTTTTRAPTTTTTTRAPTSTTTTSTTTTTTSAPEEEYDDYSDEITLPGWFPGS